MAKEDSIIKPGNLSKDTSLVEQPTGSTTFALNVVNETDEGDRTLRTTENSNEECYTLPLNTYPIGKCYIGNNETLLMLVSQDKDSYIGIVDSECNYTTIITDKDQDEKFGFRIDKQIDITYRLRRGCERTIYFVDPKPRTFVIEKLEKYQNDDFTWNINKFNLFKKYSKIPNFASIEVEETGSLPSGTYNLSVRYLDEDLNPTEFVNSSKVIRIYNDSVNNVYREIRGSTSTISPYENFGVTNKAIKIELSKLDTDFPFYQLAITECNTGNGQISDTKYTSEIATSNKVFTYTGLNYESIGTQAEVLAFSNFVEEATSIEQLENTLILTDTKDKDINFCKLQKYASKITADAISKQILLSQMSNSNAKSPTLNVEGEFYMPGEIHAFGIVYIFKDNTTTPVLHIPGKSQLSSDNTTFTINSFPMRKDNFSEDNQYTDNNSCGDDSLWGVDYLGNALINTPVRHHRFPYRSDVGLPFVKKVPEASVPVSNLFKKLKIKITGEIAVPNLCAEEGEVGYSSSCIDEVFLPFQYRVTYTVDGITDYYVGVIDPNEFGNVGGTDVVVSFLVYSNNVSSDNVVVVSLEEEGAIVASTITTEILNTDAPSPKNLTYEVSVVDDLFQSEEDIYTASGFGIRFSNIQLPSIEDTNGYEIIGYYIVRQERTEEEKTVLDSAVLTSTIKNKNFVAHGLLMPELLPPTTSVKKDVYSLINPEFKFNNLKYINFNIKQIGRFDKIDAIKSRTKIEDVQDGSSYDSKRHKKSNSDDDGWTLQIKTRDNITEFIVDDTLLINKEDIKNVFYLPGLGDKEILDSTNTGIDVFNLACDNQIGIVSLENEVDIPVVTSIPYVYLTKNNTNPYSNYRLNPYYKENMNPIYFGNDNISTCDLFSGDTVISPIRYTNSILYDNRIKLRAGKTSVWNYVTGGLLLITAVALQFIPGLGTVAGIAVASLGAGLISAGAALVASGIKQDSWNKAYNDLYKKGLKETIQDLYTDWDGDCGNGTTIGNQGCVGFKKNPEDDEIQWLGDSINLWFESKVNMGLRHGATDNTSDFVNAPGNNQLGTFFQDWNWNFFGIDSVGSNEIAPTTLLDFHMVKKLTYLDTKRKSGRAYYGVALAELYKLNPDYTRTDKQKIFNHLPLEYDCCSDCNETFPHRIAYSLQSFQEELTDNFRIFLPNNYKDIEAETGRITDAFRMYNKLYIHTEEALWEFPQNIQERVTGEIISFLGTGDYFSIPPRKIVDDSNSSAGNIHKWARIKTKYGVLFPCHKEKKWYLFDGQKLEPISDSSMSNEFKENMHFLMDRDYFISNSKNYHFANNPSNPLGTGYISTYDTKKERLIVTKKDFKISNLPNSDYELCIDSSGNTIFNNFGQTIIDQELLGWKYKSIRDCQIVFSKQVLQDGFITTYERVSIFKDVDYLVFKYNFNGTTGGSDLDTRTKLLIPTIVGPMGYSGVNTLNNYLKWSGDNTGTGLESILIDVKKIKEDFPLATNIVFNSAAWWYASNPGGGIMNIDAEAYKGGTMSLVGFLFTNSLGTLQGTYSFEDKFIPESPTSVAGVPEGAANQIGNFTYTFQTGDLSWDGASGGAIPPTTIIQETIIPIQYLEEIYEYVDGTPFVPQYLNNSWTMSYSLKDKQWVSYHSYLPSFYFYVQEKFYSWKQGINKIYRHNRKNHYLTFYGVYYPFIIEIVDVSSPLVSKIHDGITIQTEAKRWDADAEDYIDVNDITFNKILVYNTHQISGLLNMVVKQANNTYINNQITNTVGSITIDRNERNWSINELRDMSISTSVSMFKKKLTDIQNQYYIDKIVNPDRINMNKNWMERQSFRDKFLVIRLIFDTFDDTRLIMNFSVQDSKQSER